MDAKILQGDCLNIMPTLDSDSVDSIITDPPYGLTFMGKEWDRGVPGEAFWQEALRVAKPGAYLLAFGGTRTHHRLACAIEDAGWEIRDCIMWLYGSGFPKSHNVAKAIDKAAGAEREVVGRTNVAGMFKQDYEVRQGYRPENGLGGYAGEREGADITAPATEAAKQWDGWGTALKPAWEPIIMARKPLNGTVAANVLAHGTGAINVDGCRVGTVVETWSKSRSYPYGKGRTYGSENAPTEKTQDAPAGRWPANLIHDGSDEVVGLFPVTGGEAKPRTLRRLKATTGWSGGSQQTDDAGAVHCDSGSAARFFYCAKASKRDRDEGCEGLDEDARRMFASGGRTMVDGEWVETNSDPKPRRNHHPTVKPTDLMRYLCRLVTPPGGTVLDPFMGSGSTGKAAMLEGFDFIGIELQLEYAQIAQTRIEHAKQGATLKQ